MSTTTPAGDDSGRRQAHCDQTALNLLFSPHCHGRGVPDISPQCHGLHPPRRDECACHQPYFQNIKLNKAHVYDTHQFGILRPERPDTLREPTSCRDAVTTTEYNTGITTTTIAGSHTHNRRNQPLISFCGESGRLIIQLPSRYTTFYGMHTLPGAHCPQAQKGPHSRY